MSVLKKLKLVLLIYLGSFLILIISCKKELVEDIDSSYFISNNQYYETPPYYGFNLDSLSKRDWDKNPKYETVFLESTTDKKDFTCSHKCELYCYDSSGVRYIKSIHSYLTLGHREDFLNYKEYGLKIHFDELIKADDHKKITSFINNIDLHERVTITLYESQIGWGLSNDIDYRTGEDATKKLSIESITFKSENKVFVKGGFERTRLTFPYDGITHMEDNYILETGKFYLKFCY